MRQILHSLFVVFLIAMSNSATDANPLDSFRWNYRILLVAAPATEVEERVAELKAAQAGIDERKVLWFVIDRQSVTSNHKQVLEEDFQSEVLKRYFKSIKAENTAVRLIGKDGGVKERAKTLDLARLFARIDAMPMRQAEMK